MQKALLELHHHDNHLIKNDGSERSIAHCLAVHLQKIFPEYNVDCEYNVNIESPSGKKEIDMLKHELEAFDRNTRNRRSIIIEDETYYAVSVFPDIIIHKRGRNDENLIIFELKKSSSNIPYSYDELKLRKYTGELKSSLKYKYGVFIEIATQMRDDYKFKVKIFENGEEKESFCLGV